MTLNSASDIEDALAKVGALLQFRRQEHALAIVGGAALNLLGIVTRTTSDVDVLGMADPHEVATRMGAALREAPEPWPEDLRQAAAEVARDLGLDSGWLNNGPTLQLRSGLPHGMEARIRWRQFGALWVGIPAREDLLALKLFAAVDRSGPRGVDTMDMMALAPTPEELAQAHAWVATQDASPEFATTLEKVCHYLRSNLAPNADRTPR